MGTWLQPRSCRQTSRPSARARPPVGCSARRRRRGLGPCSSPGRARWEGAREGRATAWCLLDPDLPMHQRQEALADRQAQPGAEAGLPLARLVEGVEELLAEALGDTVAVIDDADGRLGIGPFGTHL